MPTFATQVYIVGKLGLIASRLATSSWPLSDSSRILSRDSHSLVGGEDTVFRFLEYPRKLLLILHILLSFFCGLVRGVSWVAFKALARIFSYLFLTSSIADGQNELGHITQLVYLVVYHDRRQGSEIVAGITFWQWYTELCSIAVSRLDIRRWLE